MNLGLLYNSAVIIIIFCFNASYAAGASGDDGIQQFRAWAEQASPYPDIPSGWALSEEKNRKTIADSVKRQGRHAGYIIFSRPSCELISLGTIPETSDVTHSINTYVAQNEYEPFTFSVHALRDLREVNITVGRIKDGDGNIFGENMFDVRSVGFVRKIVDRSRKKYELLSFMLEKKMIDIKAGTTRQFWITLKVPPEMHPGNYKGSIFVKPANAPESVLEIIIHVLPFELNNSPVVRFMWGPKKLKYQKNRYSMFIDLKEHGMTTLIVQGSVKNRDGSVQKDDIAKIINELEQGISAHRNNKFRDPPIGGINNNQIIYYWDRKINWFRFWPVTGNRRNEFLNTYKQVFIVYGEEHGWPEMLHYIVDEPGGMRPENLEPSAAYLKIFKKEFPHFRTFVTIGGGTKQGYDEADILGEYLDVPVTNYVTENMRNVFGHENKKLWIYNNGSFGDSDPILDRFFFGYYAWITGAGGVGQWVYAWGNPFESIFQDESGYVYETDQGFLPSIHWEMVREGIDDLNYIYTLESLIQNGKRSDDEKMRNQAHKEALKLKQIKDRLLTSFKAGKRIVRKNIHLSSRDFDDLRRSVSEGILSLRNIQ